MIDGDETPNRGFSLVEHPMSPRARRAPLHLHTREDEYSYILEGRMGALLGTRWSRPGPAIRPSSRATSGTRSGTRATSRAGSSRSSPADLRAVLRRAGRLGGALQADPAALAS